MSRKRVKLPANDLSGNRGNGWKFRVIFGAMTQMSLAIHKYVINLGLSYAGANHCN